MATIVVRLRSRSFSACDAGAKTDFIAGFSRLPTYKVSTMQQIIGRGNGKPELQRVTGAGVCVALTHAGCRGTLWGALVSGDSSEFLKLAFAWRWERSVAKYLRLVLAGRHEASLVRPDFRSARRRGGGNADQINSVRHATARSDRVRGNGRQPSVDGRYRQRDTGVARMQNRADASSKD